MTTLHRISYIDGDQIRHEWHPTMFTANDRANELVTLGMESVDFEEVEVPWDHVADLIHFLNNNVNNPPVKERKMIPPTIGELQNMSPQAATEMEQQMRRQHAFGAAGQVCIDPDGYITAIGPEPVDKIVSALEQQVGGDHYKKLGEYQPWEVLRRWLTPEEFRGYMKGQAIAYLARERDKGGDEDVAKAGHYLQGLLELQE